MYDDDFRLLDIPESASRRPRADLGLSQLQSLNWNPKPKNSNQKFPIWKQVRFTNWLLFSYSLCLMSKSKLPSQFQRSFKIWSFMLLKHVLKIKRKTLLIQQTWPYNVANKKGTDDSIDDILLSCFRKLMQRILWWYFDSYFETKWRKTRSTLPYKKL